MRGRLAVVVALVVLAGCTSLPVDLPAPGEPSVAGTPTEAGPGTPTVDPDNSWRERTLTVAISRPDGDDRDYEPHVREALDWWADGNAERYAGFPVDFELAPDAEDPDLVVAFVERVSECDGVTEAAGCAPYITAPGQVNRPETVEVLAGLSDDSTVLVLEHEIGHVLGLAHDDEPARVMSAQEQLTTLPQPDADERALPWRDPELTVFVDYWGVDVDDRDAVHMQVRHAMDYFERGAEGHVPANVSLRFTDNRSAADVIVSFPREAPCGDGGSGSCGYRYGVDPDGDDAPEWYTRVEITAAGIDVDAVGWHVAYWLGYGLGFTEEADWPEILRDATPEERRGEWWTTGP